MPAKFYTLWGFHPHFDVYLSTELEKHQHIKLQTPKSNIKIIPNYEVYIAALQHFIVSVVFLQVKTKVSISCEGL